MTSPADLSDLFRALLLVFAPALLLGLLWWGRNIAVYGPLDVIAKAAHDAVVVGQPQTVEWIAQYGLLGTIGRFLRTTFNSFWGQFGWMAAPLPGWIYWPLVVATLAAAVGLILPTIRRLGDSRHPTTDDRRQKERDVSPVVRGPWSVVATPAFVLILTFLLTLALHVFYNLTFVQHQGRYLFPALIPIAVGFTAGLGYWLRPILRRWPRAGYLLPLGFAVMLGGIAFYALWRIIPGLAPG